MSRLTRTLFLATNVIIIFVRFTYIEPAFATNPSIRWEVENRFRYFKRASDFREIAKVYDDLKTADNSRPSALQLERALERSAIRAGLLDGWFAKVFEQTCGREPTHKYSSCTVQNGDDADDKGEYDNIGFRSWAMSPPGSTALFAFAPSCQSSFAAAQGTIT